MAYRGIMFMDFVRCLIFSFYLRMETGPVSETLCFYKHQTVNKVHKYDSLK
jgi:hypothetical protein